MPDKINWILVLIVGDNFDLKNYLFKAQINGLMGIIARRLHN